MVARTSPPAVDQTGFVRTPHNWAYNESYIPCSMAFTLSVLALTVSMNIIFILSCIMVSGQSHARPYIPEPLQFCTRVCLGSCRMSIIHRMSSIIIKSSALCFVVEILAHFSSIGDHDGSCHFNLHSGLVPHFRIVPHFRNSLRKPLGFEWWCRQNQHESLACEIHSTGSCKTSTRARIPVFMRFDLRIQPAYILHQPPVWRLPVVRFRRKCQRQEQLERPGNSAGSKLGNSMLM